MDLLKIYLSSENFLARSEKERLEIIHTLVKSNRLECLEIQESDIYQLYFTYLFEYSNNNDNCNASLDQITHVRQMLKDLKNKVIHTVTEYENEIELLSEELLQLQKIPNKPNTTPIIGRKRQVTMNKPKLEKSEKQIFTNDIEKTELAKTPETTSSGTLYSLSEIFDLPISMFKIYDGRE